MSVTKLNFPEYTGCGVTGNGVSKMFFTIVAAFAEFEHDRITERISDVKICEKERGSEVK